MEGPPRIKGHAFVCKTTVYTRAHTHCYPGVGWERVGVIATKCVYYIIYRKSDDIKTNELAKKPRKIYRASSRAYTVRVGVVFIELCAAQHNRVPEGLGNFDVIANFYFFFTCNFPSSVLIFFRRDVIVYASATAVYSAVGVWDGVWFSLRLILDLFSLFSALSG
jgi:hypothetical protein